MTWTQAPEAPLVDVDPIDLLVPPPRRLRRSLFLAGITVLVIVVVIALSSTGLVRPKLGPTSNASYRAASSSTTPNLAFNVRNDGSFPLTLSGADTREPGLSDGTVTIATLGAGGERGLAQGFPLRLGSGQSARVTMTFATWNCVAIEPHGNTTVPFHLSGPLGLDTMVSVVPGFHFDPPDTGVLIGAPDQNEIGWAAGITWTSCHPGSGPPNAATP